MSRHYRLVSSVSGRSYDDDGLLLAEPDSPVSGLLMTDYHSLDFRPGPDADGIYRFDFWLPVIRRLEGSSAPVTWRSEGLAEYLGLENLYITFSGYWPERGARMLTGTFKECEAYSVCARTADAGETLVVASAGNTARAFARVCSDNRLPLVLVIPEKNLDALWLTEPLGDSVFVVAVGDGADYADAIHASGVIAALPGYRAEGGARNVARRDGMATTLLSAIEAIGGLPHEYFQAVGSGTGAIAAREAADRYLKRHASPGSSPNTGADRMRLRLSQNAPFLPLYESWRARSRTLVEYEENDAKRRLDGIFARVLANRTPPWSVAGGLFDALSAGGGDIAAIANEQAVEAATLFERLEGVDPAPAAAVAIASLMQAVEAKSVDRHSTVMLNVTGGGFKRLWKEVGRVPITPDLVIGRDEISPGRISARLNGR